MCPKHVTDAARGCAVKGDAASAVSYCRVGTVRKKHICQCLPHTTITATTATTTTVTVTVTVAVTATVIVITLCVAPLRAPVTPERRGNVERGLPLGVVGDVDGCLVDKLHQTCVRPRHVAPRTGEEQRLFHGI